MIAFQHHSGGGADAVDVVIAGGTSASAPEVAASAAVIMQVARLTGQPFEGPRAVRDFLEKTGTPVPKVPEADTDIHVGPQVNLGHAVETLLKRADIRSAHKVARVAIEQRRGRGNGDAVFQSNTDPNHIDLSGANAKAWITIAPDWEGIRKPDKAHYRLTVSAQPNHHGKPHVLATTPWARLQPKTILQKADLSFGDGQPHTVYLTYRATGGGSGKTQVTKKLTFGPASGDSNKVLAPNVPGVIRSSTIPVQYDLSHVSGGGGATLVVSEPGRVNPYTGAIFHPAYTTSIGSGKGTVDVPVSALFGGGIYGIGIKKGNGDYSDFAYTRVQPQPENKTRPAAPLVSAPGASPGHRVEIPYGGEFTLSWNVSNVPGASGAMLEISAPAPNPYNSYKTFNNPNGSERDHNGIDSGSVTYRPLPGTSGTITLNGLEVGLIPTMHHVVRVIPVTGRSAAGEASNVSTVLMDGVKPVGGGLVNRGWGINKKSYDGFLVATQPQYLPALGGRFSSVQTFDQRTKAITETVVSGVHGNPYATLGTVYADTGIFRLGLPTTHGKVLDVSAGKITSPWTPPYKGLVSITTGSANSSNGTGFFLGYKPGFDAQAYTSNVAANTFSPLYDVAGPLAGHGLALYEGIDLDTETQAGALVAEDIFGNCDAVPVVTVDFDSGDVGAFASGLGGGLTAVAIDSNTGKAIISAADCGQNPDIGIVDLAAKELVGTAMLPGQNRDTSYAASDEVHHLFLTEQVVGPDYGIDNNVMSIVSVVSETGDVLRTYEKFNLFNVVLTQQARLLQVNPNTRTAYTEGPGQQQIQPFHY